MRIRPVRIVRVGEASLLRHAFGGEHDRPRAATERLERLVELRFEVQAVGERSSRRRTAARCRRGSGGRCGDRRLRPAGSSPRRGRRRPRAPHRPASRRWRPPEPAWRVAPVRRGAEAKPNIVSAARPAAANPAMIWRRSGPDLHSLRAVNVKGVNTKGVNVKGRTADANAAKPKGCSSHYSSPVKPLTRSHPMTCSQ